MRSLHSATQFFNLRGLNRVASDTCTIESQFLNGFVSIDGDGKLLFSTKLSKTSEPVKLFL